MFWNMMLALHFNTSGFIYGTQVDVGFVSIFTNNWTLSVLLKYFSDVLSPSTYTPTVVIFKKIHSSEIENMNYFMRNFKNQS